MIVCIPSKGRPKTKTHKIFEEAGYDVYHFVEPQDYDSYEAVTNRVNIGKDDMGMTFVRNFMLDWCRQQNHEWAWVCDDDITAFGIYNGKTIRKDGSILKEIEAKAMKLPFEIVGMSFAQFAWTEKKRHSINSKFAEGCVLLHISKIHWNYRENTKEDRDFLLQSIEKGNGVLRFNHYWFNTPKIGSNAGGLHDWYKTNKDHDAARKMAMTWSPWVTLKQKPDRLDIKADIKGYAKHCMRKVL